MFAFEKKIHVKTFWIIFIVFRFNKLFKFCHKFLYYQEYNCIIFNAKFKDTKGVCYRTNKYIDWAINKNFIKKLNKIMDGDERWRWKIETKDGY